MAAQRIGILIFLTLAAAILNGCTKAPDNGPSTNVLSIGPSSQIADQLSIPLVAPVTLNGQSADQIVEARSAIISQNPKLLAEDYKPTRFLFNRIDPKLDWESLRATYFDGPTKMCGAGPSTESTAILNPFLLVSARFLWQPMWEGRLSWAADQNWAQKIDRPDFPLYLKPSQLTWFPRESRAEVTYSLSDFIARVSPWIKGGISMSDASFTLHAANARDFQLKYLYISPESSKNIMLSKPFDFGLKLLDYFYARKFKEASAPCNGGGFPAPFISGLRASALPADAVLFLWRQRPTTVKDKPDMKFIIHIE